MALSRPHDVGARAIGEVRTAATALIGARIEAITQAAEVEAQTAGQDVPLRCGVAQWWDLAGR